MINFQFEKLDSIDSTNDYLTRELEKGNIIKDKIVVAKHQENGHGMNGKTFSSPKDVGIYFSMLHFYENDKELEFITQKVAVAIYKTFYEIFNIELKIKWVNDLYYNEKKVCGILCRNLIKHRAVLIGVGIDLFENKNLDNDLKDIAGFIFKDKRDLVDKLNSNKKISKDSCTYKNIYEDFKSLKIEGIDIRDEALWETEQLTIEMVMRIYNIMKVPGLPQIYIDKNIIKDKKIYEDCILEC